jgi:hypothetical protein
MQLLLLEEDPQMIQRREMKEKTLKCIFHELFKRREKSALSANCFCTRNEKEIHAKVSKVVKQEPKRRATATHRSGSQKPITLSHLKMREKKISFPIFFCGAIHDHHQILNLFFSSSNLCLSSALLFVQFSSCLKINRLSILTS